MLEILKQLLLLIIEHKEIKKIDDGFISEGMVLKKYISSGNKLILKNCT